jgi:hypothetical protein
MAEWYVGSTKYTAVTAWAATTAYSVGDLRRQLATPTAGNERVFRCTTAGTSGGSEPTWTLTIGSTTNDGTAVWTEVTGNSTYGWNAAHARIANALAWSAAGDTIYVSHAHAYSLNGNITWSATTSMSAPHRISCVNDGASPPTTPATTATETTSSGSGTFTYNGASVVDGLTVNCNGTGTINIGTSNASLYLQWKNGTINCAGNSSSRINFGSSGSTNARDQLVELVNTTLNFTNAGQGVNAYCPLRWSNTPASAVTGTIPTALFVTPLVNTMYAPVQVNGVNLSALGSGKTLVNSGAGFGNYEFRNCQLHASVTLASGNPTSGPGGQKNLFINVDSGDTNYKYQSYEYQGQVSQETVIVKTSGSTDGTTAFSRKFVSSANSNIVSPLVGPAFRYWASAGSNTVEVDVVTDNVTLTDAEAWIDIRYPGTSSLPLYLTASDRVASFLATPANQATSSATWTTTGLTTPVYQKLSATFTVAEAGWVSVFVTLAKASTTMYADCKLLSDSTQKMNPDGSIVSVATGSALFNPLGSFIVRGAGK